MDSLGPLRIWNAYLHILSEKFEVVGRRDGPDLIPSGSREALFIPVSLNS